MKNEEKSPIENLGEPWTKISRQLTYIEILNIIKNILKILPSKIFFTYEEDKNTNGLYHIYFNDVFFVSAHFASIDNLQSFLKSLEYAALKGSGYALEEIVDSMQDKIEK